VTPPVERPAVSRPSADREQPLEAAPPDASPQDLEALVDAALAAGAPTFSAVLEQVLPRVPVPRRYRAIGRIAAQVAGRVPVVREHERQWVAVLDEARVEEWQLVRKESR
jgi:hypothetical protein